MKKEWLELMCLKTLLIVSRNKYCETNLFQRIVISYFNLAKTCRIVMAVTLEKSRVAVTRRILKHEHTK